jgi:hypothetical protein
MLYHPVLPNLPRDPASNPARLRNPEEWGMQYVDVEVTGTVTLIRILLFWLMTIPGNK